MPLELMKRHLYNAGLGKVVWFIKRFGWKELFLKPIRVTLAPLILPRLPKGTFLFRGRLLECFYHSYNMTWACERCVEVPIGRSYLAGTEEGSVLEVGNVLSHYGPVAHDVLDKFEKASGVINEDIAAFAPAKKYDLILSISTFEHIGFDDEAAGDSGEKILDAIAACRRLLSPGGKLVITVPIGYNPSLDALVRKGELAATSEVYLKRTGGMDWRAVEKADALACRYKHPHPYANAILVAEFSAAHP